MIRIIIAVLAALLGGWLTADGFKAMVSVDYTTSRDGAYAGQLGPWAKLVTAAGVNPRGTPMKVAHIVLGLLWVIGVIMWFTNPFVGRRILVGCSICSLWYLPFGMLIGIAELALIYYTRPKS